ncbi:MAG: hypothetical protein F2536_04285, partial [Actinobacteria bacterium]|nr:hypothetical protein [Actinomycetota bacterium]
MKTKKLIAALAALVTVFALAGCSLSREVASLDPYSPSDGVQVDLPELKARNVLFVSDAEGNSVLIGSFLNTTDATLVAQLETMDSNGKVVLTDITIPAQGKFDLGYNGTEGKRLFLTELPGSMHPVYIRAGG